MAQFLGSPQHTLITIELPRYLPGEKSPESVSVTLGAVQQFAYQVRRYKAPVYVIGSSSPISIAKGARSVAGTMQGIILDESFQINLIKYFLVQIKDSGAVKIIKENGLPRLQGTAELSDVFGGKTNFVAQVLDPIVKYLGVSDGAKDDDVVQISDTVLAGSDLKLPDSLKIPPIYLDEIPPIKLHLITPLKLEGDVMTYEQTTFYGLEFLNNDLAIQAGQEAIFESVNFIQRAVTKSIKTAE